MFHKIYYGGSQIQLTVTLELSKLFLLMFDTFPQHQSSHEIVVAVPRFFYCGIPNRSNPRSHGSCGTLAGAEEAVSSKSGISLITTSSLVSFCSATTSFIAFFILNVKSSRRGYSVENSEFRTEVSLRGCSCLDQLQRPTHRQPGVRCVD